MWVDSNWKKNSSCFVVVVMLFMWFLFQNNTPRWNGLWQIPCEYQHRVASNWWFFCILVLGWNERIFHWEKWRFIRMRKLYVLLHWKFVSIHGILCTPMLEYWFWCFLMKHSCLQNVWCRHAMTMFRFGVCIIIICFAMNMLKLIAAKSICRLQLDSNFHSLFLLLAPITAQQSI